MNLNYLKTITLGVLCIMTGISCSVLKKEKKNNSDLLRGFTTQKMSLHNLEIMKNEWNANSVRLMMRPDFISRKKGFKSYQEGWDHIIQNLPAYLNKARDLNMAVILDLHGVPNDNIKKYPKDSKARKAAFWQDNKNLKTMLKCWQQIADICYNRKQVIWFDLFNEPLNWDDMPGYAKKWPQWAQCLIDEIRKTDKTHSIIVEVGPGGLCWGFKTFPLLKGDNIIYSTHQYQPHEYTHQGISQLKNTDLLNTYIKTQKSWPGKFGDAGGGLWNKERLEKELAPIIKFQKKHNVRIYIGEFGVARWAPECDQYLEDNIAIFEKYGWDWSYHSFRESSVWDAEFKDTMKKKKAEKLSKRGKVLLKYMKNNKEI